MSRQFEEHLHYTFIHDKKCTAADLRTSELELEHVSDATLVLSVDEVFTLHEATLGELRLFDWSSLGCDHIIAIQGQLHSLLGIYNEDLSLYHP